MEKLNIEDFKDNEEEVIDFNKLEADCYLDLSLEITPPEILLSIGSYEYKQKIYPTPVMTAGEFSAIIATSKSKKTFLKSAFLSSYIGGKSNELFPNIRSHRDKNYTVLDFDTEQGKFYTQRTFRRVLEMVNANYDHYKGYATRHLSSHQRLLLIDYCLKNQKELYKVPVKLISIDDEEFNDADIKNILIIPKAVEASCAPLLKEKMNKTNEIL